MAGLGKVVFARFTQPAQQALHFKPLAGFQDRPNLLEVRWRYDRTIKPGFDAPQNQEHRIRFKAYAKLILIIKWAAKDADIKVEGLHGMSIRGLDHHSGQG